MRGGGGGARNCARRKKADGEEKEQIRNTLTCVAQPKNSNGRNTEIVSGVANVDQRKLERWETSKTMRGAAGNLKRGCGAHRSSTP